MKQQARQTIDNPYFDILQFTPWRIELANLGDESLMWLSNR